MNTNVLWKIDGKFDKLPANVRTEKWVSQQDILSHKNIKLFITHGGLLSTMESIHYGVPLIGMPCFADQFMNMMEYDRKNVSITLDINDHITIVRYTKENI